MAFAAPVFIVAAALSPPPCSATCSTRSFAARSVTMLANFPANPFCVPLRL
jgi:hypothetical protein